ncbi:DNA packaging terminase subunit 1 [Gallid alphaherpesvirus 1]|uniref:DNA packaging terminase subunit 1 n=1 Tax=Infectious laryngotracheitis virus TaxID=10386 RepID=A0A0K0K5U4_ILTV|nr:DNA packaging terminase subunit 1 [Gallid alphaherpesvirus 1]
MLGKESVEIVKRYRDALRKRTMERGPDDVDGQEMSDSNFITTASICDRNDSARDTMNSPASRFQFAIDVPQRHQACIAPIGSFHNCCAISRAFSYMASEIIYENLASYSTKYTDTDAALNDLQVSPKRQLFTGATEDSILPALRQKLANLNFARFAPSDSLIHDKAFDGIMNGYRGFVKSDEFSQLNNFIYRFHTLLKKSFSGQASNDYKRAKLEKTTSDQRDGTLELFQKMILMHATYFASSICLGEGSTERSNRYLSTVFNTSLFSENIIQHFRQRTTVFLVPRRHGKTWFLVPLISLLVSSFEGIRIGYTAHLRKATEPVFIEIFTRLYKWFGAKQVEQVKGETITFTFRNGNKSAIVFASSQNTNGLRGQDFNFLFVDEANFIKPAALHTVMGFLNQTNCKLFFVSSTNTCHSNTSLLYNLKGKTNSLLNVVTYICDEHMPEIQKRTDVTTCSCYVLHKPVFVSMDSEVRNTADLFVKDSFMHEIAGGRAGKYDSDRTLVPVRALDQFLIYRPSTSSKPNISGLGKILTVYVDPAFTTNRSASGTGIALVTALRDSMVLMGAEHFYLDALTGEAALEIAQCVYLCIAYCCLIHAGAFREIRIAVEGNSSQDSAAAIAGNLTELLDSLRRRLGFSLTFAHSRQPGTAMAHPFYLLNKQKSRAFDLFVSLFNSGRFMASQELVSNTLVLSKDPCEYLVDQIRNITVTHGQGPDSFRTFSGKQGRVPDDMLVAAVMSTYLPLEGSPTAGYHPIAPIGRRQRPA